MNRSDMWAHVHVSDDTSHGMGFVSPGFTNEAELRAWIAAARIEHSRSPGFQLDVYRRSWNVDEKGDPIAGTGDDRSQQTHEQLPDRERHMAFVRELSEVLKNVEKPLTRGRKPREPKVDEEPF